MATIQRETRRFFAHLFLSHASLVLVGLELHTELSLTGSLCLWFSVILSLGGFGLTLRALEARFGRLSLTDFHGLYEHSPTLAVCFLLTGLASVGFPGTLGFISTELLVDSAVEANPYVGIAVVAAAALNGIAVVRAYFLLFTGARHVSTVSLGLGLRERIAVLTLAALILGGGLFPQPGVMSRERAADEVLALRARNQGRSQANQAKEAHHRPPLVSLSAKNFRWGLVRHRSIDQAMAQVEQSPARSRIAAWATGLGQDQTRKKRAWRAHRWAGSSRRKPEPLRAVRYACVSRRTRALAWPRTVAEVGAPGRPSAVARRSSRSRSQASRRASTGSSQVVPAGGFERLERGERLAERQGRGLQAARPGGGRAGHHVGRRAGQEVVLGRPRPPRRRPRPCRTPGAPPGRTAA